MAKALKHMLASQLGTELEASPAGLMVIDPGGMTVEASMALRKKLRDEAGGARLRVLHNRTARVALREQGYDGDVEALNAALKGSSALVYGGDGPISIAKVVREWARKNKTVKVKGAIADGEVLVGPDAETLADMPDLQQLKGMLAGLIIGTARGLAVSLQAVYGGLARCIQARADDGGFGSGAEAAEVPAAEVPAEVVAPVEEAAPEAETPAADAAPEGSTE
ncbi:MAG: 50S ribosomal protein L10 [Planctomycetota bacterium]|nr:50S ribosomal protein L10 [Planctomycetota bacterium]